MLPADRIQLGGLGEEPLRGALDALVERFEQATGLDGSSIDVIELESESEPYYDDDDEGDDDFDDGDELAYDGD
jgi:hypothetical protein